MDTSLDRALTRLDKDAVLRIRDGRCKGIAVFSGVVWVTQEGDLKDAFVESGESFVFDRAGLSVVQALEDSSLLVFDAEPADIRCVER